MGDMCAVELRLQLPRAVAAELAEMQRRDPEAVSKMLCRTLERPEWLERLARKAESSRKPAG